MRLAKSLLLFYFLLSTRLKHLSISYHLCAFFPVAHFFHKTFARLSLSPSLWDGHLIHLTSWKDKYSSVQCEAPASPLTQTGDEGKVSLFIELRCPNALMMSSTQTDTDTKMAPKHPVSHRGFPYLKVMQKYIKGIYKALRNLVE